MKSSTYALLAIGGLAALYFLSPSASADEGDSIAKRATSLKILDLNDALQAAGGPTNFPTTQGYAAASGAPQAATYRAPAFSTFAQVIDWTAANGLSLYVPEALQMSAPAPVFTFWIVPKGQKAPKDGFVIVN